MTKMTRAKKARKAGKKRLCYRLEDLLRGVAKPRVVICPRKRPRYRLDDLLKEARKHGRQTEIDFGPPVGREVL